MRAIFTLAAAVTLLAVATQAQEAQQPAARFHHAHINAMDPGKSIEFYKKYFSGVPIKYRDKVDAVLVDRSYLLFTKVDEPAPWEMISAIYHIGWGGVDGPSEFEWRDELGVEWETPLSPLGNEWFMYVFGPDKEVAEVWTGFRHNRFGHVHLFSDDVNAAAKWYMEHLGLEGPPRDIPKPPPPPKDFVMEPGSAAIFRHMWASAVRTEGDAVTINIFGTPDEEYGVWWAYDPITELVPTKGRVIDHMAFSYADIDPVFERMKAAGVTIVEEIKEREEYGFRSFFVEGPDQTLIEIVEEQPVPEGSWE